MRQVIESKRHLLKLTLPGEFLFLFRICFELMSVLARLKARSNWYRFLGFWGKDRRIGRYGCDCEGIAAAS